MHLHIIGSVTLSQIFVRGVRGSTDSLVYFVSATFEFILTCASVSPIKFTDFVKPLYLLPSFRTNQSKSVFSFSDTKDIANKLILLWNFDSLTCILSINNFCFVTVVTKFQTAGCFRPPACKNKNTRFFSYKQLRILVSAQVAYLYSKNQ